MMKFIKLILVLGIVAALIYVLRYPSVSLDVTTRINEQNKSITGSNKDYSSLLTKIENERIFTAASRQGVAHSTITDQSLSKLVENFRLAGVMSSGGMKAIIEDKKKAVTINAKEGQTFSDNIRVEKINSDSVSLTRDGEQAELRL